jgi:large subunit ribosomal protein L15
LPFKRGQGFTPPNQVEYNEVNLDQLAAAFKANAKVDPETLQKARLLRDPRNPTVILGRGELKVALKVRVHRVSRGAQAKIEKAGGSVETIT